MESLDYCFRCFKDVEVWEKLVASYNLVVVRCPHCKAVYTLYPDGSVRLQS